jgi:DNA-binding GntR family transcriptional regulator
MRLGKTQPPEHLHEVVQEHVVLVDAIERRDLDGALAALHEHLHHWDYLLASDYDADSG